MLRQCSCVPDSGQVEQTASASLSLSTSTSLSIFSLLHLAWQAVLLLPLSPALSCRLHGFFPILPFLPPSSLVCPSTMPMLLCLCACMGHWWMDLSFYKRRLWSSVNKITLPLWKDLWEGQAEGKRKEGRKEGRRKEKEKNRQKDLTPAILYSAPHSHYLPSPTPPSPPPPPRRWLGLHHLSSPSSSVSGGSTTSLCGNIMAACLSAGRRQQRRKCVARHQRRQNIL